MQARKRFSRVNGFRSQRDGPHDGARILTPPFYRLRRAGKWRRQWL
jgi:hypothetical protein